MMTRSFRSWIDTETIPDCVMPDLTYASAVRSGYVDVVEGAFRIRIAEPDVDTGDVYDYDEDEEPADV